MDLKSLLGQNISKSLASITSGSGKLVGKAYHSVTTFARWVISPVTNFVHSTTGTDSDGRSSSASKTPSTPLSERSVNTQSSYVGHEDPHDNSEDSVIASLPQESENAIRQWNGSNASPAVKGLQRARHHSQIMGASIKSPSSQATTIESEQPTQVEKAQQAIEISDEVIQTLQKGLDTANPDDMPQILGEYTVAVGRLVQQQGEISETQQGLMRKGYIELLAHDQELKNPHGYIQKNFGISGGKRAIAMRVDMLEQVRDALRVGGQTMATQISGAARSGPFMASQIDMLGCQDEKELRDLVFGRGLNIDMFCVSGAETNITDAQARVAKKENQLADELAKPVEEQRPEDIARFRKSISEGETFIAKNRAELEEKQTQFADKNTRHLDQLFFDVATLQEQKRRESLPEALTDIITATLGHNNKEKYQNPDKIVDSAAAELMTAAETKVLGHMANVNGNWSAEEKREKIEAEFNVRAQKLRCAYNELLLQHAGLEKFKTLPHLKSMTDDDRGILRDHLLRNLPVNIPLAHKEKLLTVAKNRGVVSSGPCSEEEFAKDLDVVTSPLQSGLLGSALKTRDSDDTGLPPFD